MKPYQLKIICKDYDVYIMMGKAYLFYKKKSKSTVYIYISKEYNPTVDWHPCPWESESFIKANMIYFSKSILSDEIMDDADLYAKWVEKRLKIIDYKDFVLRETNLNIGY